MKRVLIVFLFLGVFFLTLIYSPAPVFAVTVGPPKIEYRADPGTVIEGTLVLINEGGTKQTFWSAFEKFTEVGGEKKFLPGEPTELANWFNLPKSVTLEQKGQKNIPFTIEIPKNAPPGGHFAVIWWGTAPPGGLKQVSIVTRAGILVYLRVSGEVNESAEVLKFSAEGEKFFWGKMPENFVVLFKNSGNTYLKPQGEILIKNIFGGKVANFGVNEVGMIFLPDTENTLRIAKKFEKAPFAFGLYKAELALHWGEKQNNIQKSIYLFVFPWKTVLLVIIILAALLLIATKGVKKYNQWIVRRSQNTNLH